MIADDGFTPILMDFGSTVKARINIENRSQALLQQVRQPNSSRHLMLMYDYRMLRLSKVQWRIALPSYSM